jgi:plastocyanin
VKLIMRTAVIAFGLSLILSTLAVTAGERPKPTTHTVTIEGMKFQPEELTVTVGDIVVWVNKDVVAHTATSSKAGIFDSKLIAPDKSWKLTVRTKGDFDYVCTYHPTMKATLRVD